MQTLCLNLNKSYCVSINKKIV